MTLKVPVHFTCHSDHVIELLETAVNGRDFNAPQAFADLLSATLTAACLLEYDEAQLYSMVSAILPEFERALANEKAELGVAIGLKRFVQ